jgi:hypothetical protein
VKAKAQSELRLFSQTKIGGLLNAFVSAHGKAWVEDCREFPSDAKMTRCWDASNDALNALREAIREAQDPRKNLQVGIEFSVVAIRIAAAKREGEAKDALLEAAQLLQADAVPDEAAFAAERRGERG